MVRVSFKIPFIIWLTLFASISWGQSDSYWYFGQNAGIHFTSSGPVALNNGALNTNEGCSSISNTDGELLFYTDGVNVFTHTHELMTDVSSEPVDDLDGDASTTQSALLVPKPGSLNEVYIITAGAIGSTQELRYSTVDMSLAGGLGQVTMKNELIYSPICEKLACVYHANGVDIWLITHEYGSNKFKNFLITSDGISATPVETAIGDDHVGGALPQFNAVGAMKCSQSGDKIACCVRDARVELFDFDSSTGIVSNYINLTPEAPNNPTYYGVEFSPSGNYLYYSQIAQADITQVDLSAGSADDIIASSIVVSGNVNNLLGQLQLAPDGKIYTARTISQSEGVGYLGVLESPDEMDCSFNANGLALAPNTFSLLGLPNFIAGDPIATEINSSYANQASQNFTIYPNPAKNQVILRFPVSGFDTYLKLYTINGALVRSSLIPKHASNLSFDCSNLLQGPYLLQIIGDKSTMCQTVIIE